MSLRAHFAKQSPVNWRLLTALAHGASVVAKNKNASRNDMKVLIFINLVRGVDACDDYRFDPAAHGA